MTTLGIEPLDHKVKVLSARGLGIKLGKWVTIIPDPRVEDAWCRVFHYKADAEQLRSEIVRQFKTVDQVIGHYGTHYWTRLEELISTT